MSQAELYMPAAAAFPAAPAGRQPKVAVVASLTSSLVNFRLELLRGLVQRGCQVRAFAPEDDRDTIERLATIGVQFTRIPMRRTATRPAEDLVTLIALTRAFRQFRPDIVLPYTMKPIIYGGIAARLTGVPHRFALMTGLGYVFIERAPDLRAAALRWLSVQLYRLALKGVERVFVYNEADASDLRDRRIVDERRLVRVPGSGVDISLFGPSAPPPGPPIFLLIARLMRDKGIAEYVQAARLLRKRYPQARFQLLGPYDANPTAISPAEIQNWVSEGVVEYLGETRDVRPYLARCSVFVLPSCYREGLPRTILEAMSTSRAVVTTDAPGCADPIEHGVTGFVVPARNPEALAAAMERFLVEPSLIASMGAAGRRRVEEKYDVHAVNRILFAGMRLDGAATAGATAAFPDTYSAATDVAP